jgi:uncharacterized membrane protein HdeD (DUF308 family)
MPESPFTLPSPEELQKYTPALTGVGCLLILLGGVSIALPQLGSFAVETFIGCLLLFGGLAHLFHAFRPDRWQGFLLDVALGAIFVLTGGLLLLYPVPGEMTLTLLLSAALVAEGVFKGIAAVQLRGHPGVGWMLFSGAMALALGILIGFEWPAASTWVLGLLVGIDLVFGGLSLVMISQKLKGASSSGTESAA